MIELSDRLTELRIENRRLKSQVQDLENKVLNLVGMIGIEQSGGENKGLINNMILEMFKTCEQKREQLNIVTPYMCKFYSTELANLHKKGVPVLMICRDRRLIMKSYQQFYDDVKTAGINIINNPNVEYLLLFNSDTAIYAGGSLDKEELDKSVLIITTIKETAKLRKIAEIFSSMLPSFMRR